MPVSPEKDHPHTDDRHLFKYPVETSVGRPLLLTAGLVLAPTAVAAFLMQNEPLSRVGGILFGNYISPVILWFFCASTLHLFNKMRLLGQEMAATRLLSDGVRQEAENEGAHSADEEYHTLAQRLHTLTPKGARHNLLLNRCRFHLKRRQGRQPTPDAASWDAVRQLEWDGQESSFALPRFMIWAIPILGFIGTVMGISDAISQFSGAMGQVDSPEHVSAVLKNTLPKVSQGLAVAFDTTFLALLLSVPLMFFNVIQQKREQKYLGFLEDIWLTEVRPALPAPALPSVPAGPLAAGVTATIHSLTGIEELAFQIQALQKTISDIYEADLMVNGRLGKDPF